MSPDFVATVTSVLSRTAMDPTSLVLEMSEHVLIDDIDLAMTVLSDLKTLGIRIALDDFGTGYSSLVFLKELPVQEIKIDKSFVLNMLGDAGDGAIVRSIIDLGKNLGLEVVAEGVESQGIMQELARQGCTTAQGFYISRPISAERLTAWLSDSSYANVRAA
jgi:diguanylate cyclase